MSNEDIPGSHSDGRAQYGPTVVDIPLAYQDSSRRRLFLPDAEEGLCVAVVVS